MKPGSADPEIRSGLGIARAAFGKDLHIAAHGADHVQKPVPGGINAHVPEQKIAAGNHQRTADEISCGRDIAGDGDCGREKFLCGRDCDDRAAVRRCRCQHLRPEGAEHAFTVVPGEGRLGDGGLSLRREAGQQDRGFYLGTGCRGFVRDAAELLSGNRERRAAVPGNASDVSPHHGERRNDPVHGTLPDGRVSCKDGVKGLRGENSAEEAHGGAAVAAVQDTVRFPKAAESLSADRDMIPLLRDPDAHGAEAGDGGETVCAGQEAGDLRGPLSQGAEHDGPVGDGFVPGHPEFAAERAEAGR